MEIDWKQIRLLAAAAAIGFFLGGMLLTPTPELKIRTFEVEKEVIVERVVEKVVEKRVLVKADKAIVTEEKMPDGTLLMRSEYFGLGLNIEEKTQESTEERVEEKTKVSETTVIETSPKNRIAMMAFVDPFDPLSFDYKRDWALSYSRRLWDSPFYGTMMAGPRIFGLGFGMSF